MPRPPRFTVRNEKIEHGESSVHPAAATLVGIVSDSGLAFPVICKPVEACGELTDHGWSGVCFFSAWVSCSARRWV